MPPLNIIESYPFVILYCIALKSKFKYNKHTNLSSEGIKMKVKQIIFTKPCVAELLESEVEAPKPEEVQVRLAVSTISSGTERANLVGDPNIATVGSGSVVFPRVAGYSSSGVVEAVGESVTEL